MPVDPTNLSPADFLRWERVGWLRALIADIRNGIDLSEDPEATADALRECEALAAELEAELAIGAVLDGKPFDLPESSYEDALEAARKRLRNLPHLP